MDIFEKKYSVSVGDADAGKRIKPSVLFDFFQRATMEHGDDLDVGLNAMLKAGQGWILCRFSVLIERRPEFGETLAVRTWPQGCQRLFWNRHYEAEDGRGNIIVRGSSCWLIMDIARRRPLRPESLITPLPPNDGRVFLEGGAAGLEKRDGLVKIAERTALYSDIDFNGHVNNARYIQWIQDALPAPFDEGGTMRIDINYVSQILRGESVGIYCGPLSDDTSADGMKRSFAIEGRTVSASSFRAEIRTG
jgi:acyl-ACP thioesterase